MKHRTLKKRYFSLIELLVVITIIGILSAIILPALSGSKKAAEKTKIASQLKQISMAVELYLSDYQSLPDATITADATTIPFSGSGIETALNGSNARGKVYYNGSGSIAGGTPNISIALDGDYDNNISSANGSTVNGSVAVWATYEGDDIESWTK